MAGIEIKHFDSPDETRPFADKGRAEIVNIGGQPVLHGIFEPGWLLYTLSGRMKVVMDDGTEGEATPGTVVKIDPGHDAWVVGDEPCEVVDFGAMPTYAQRQ